MTTFTEAMAWLDENEPFFFTLVINLGEGVEDATVPTAAIRLNQDAVDGWELAYNADYFDALTAEEAAGVISHETIHAVLRHLEEANDHNTYPDAEALLIAHECIVNDRLVNEGFVLPGSYYSGPKTLGVDTSPLTTEEVYRLIAQPKEEGSEGEDSSNASSSDSNASKDNDSNSMEEGADSENTEGEDSEGEALCSHEHRQLSPEEAEAISDGLDSLVDRLMEVAQSAPGKDSVSDEILDALGVMDSMVTRTGGMGVGDGGGVSTVQEAAERLGTTQEFMKLLAEVNPDILRKPGRARAKVANSWHAPRRSVAHMYPKVLLPQRVPKGNPDPKGEKGNKKPLVLFCLDQSGSISSAYAEKMRHLARSIPKDLVEVEACTFSTDTVPFDVESNSNRVASGGTAFSPLEKFAREAAKKHGVSYPKAIIVITDGEAYFDSVAPTREQLESNWTWLLIPAGYYWGSSSRVYDSRVPKSTVKQLSDFFKGF